MKNIEEQKYPPNDTLKQLRLERGLKQEELAKLIGIQFPDRISHWEKGTALPGISNLFKLSKILNVLPHELFPELWK